MNPLRTAARTGAFWFLPLVFALSCLFSVRSTFPSGYPAGDIAQSSVGLYIAAPIGAAFMAFQYRGFTHLLRPLRMTRSAQRVILRAWWPLIFGTPTALCLAVVVTAETIPNDLASWSLILINFMTVLTAVLTGLVCAWALPTVVAAPLAAMFWFVWIAYGPASTNLVVHNLDSTFGCCTSETQPASTAVRGTLLLLLVISIGIGCLLASPRSTRIARPVVMSVLTGLVVAGFGLGVAVLQTSKDPLNLTATEQRTTPLVCRADRGLQICLWPENRGNAPALAVLADELNAKLQQAGMNTISRLTQAHRTSNAVSVEAGSRLSEQDLRLGLAVGYVNLQSECLSGSGATQDELVAVVALLTGMRPDDLASRVGPTAVREAEHVLTQGEDSPRTVGTWFDANVSNVHCVMDQ